ncbi:hypothetical protein [Montanilutibacter psychrotolerans]|nr:hypothetical protein [Lysobacter psychrotolerans]
MPHHAAIAIHDCQPQGCRIAVSMADARDVVTVLATTVITTTRTTTPDGVRTGVSS